MYTHISKLSGVEGYTQNIKQFLKLNKIHLSLKHANTLNPFVLPGICIVGLDCIILYSVHSARLYRISISRIFLWRLPRVLIGKKNRSFRYIAEMLLAIF